MQSILCATNRTTHQYDEGSAGNATPTGDIQSGAERRCCHVQ
ncbi:hypothetical protein BIFBIF_00407 [Bifidobacterium bifidum ATCC 29521 = JCM 1255 = DSM 20456]|nr:hypothetical protein BIFBIF_00407 [Bifidobacterium bifidum ATCC 29521 = JCM 1255 = DSM 20456]